jgi:hypothetical protein
MQQTQQQTSCLLAFLLGFVDDYSVGAILSFPGFPAFFSQHPAATTKNTEHKEALEIAVPVYHRCLFNTISPLR